MTKVVLNARPCRGEKRRARKFGNDMPDSNYAYLSGKIRAMEPKILDNTDIERMVDAPDFSSAFKVLNDTDYANNLLDIEPIAYRDALRKDFEEMYRDLKSSVPEKELFEFLYLSRDFLNIKYLYKAKLFGLELENRVVTEINYPFELLRQFIMDKKNGGLDPRIKAVLEECNKEFTNQTTPAAVDSILTKKYFGLMLALAKRFKNGFVTSWIKIQINNANILTFLRGRRLSISGERLASKFIAGGDIDVGELSRLYKQEGSSLKNLISRFYDNKVKDAFFKLEDSGALFPLEKSLDDYLTRFSRAAKRITFGPEVVIAYFLAKSVAVRNVRLIMTGKLNGVPAEAIKNTLREVY